MTSMVGGALVAALAGSPHCLGMCGPLATAVGDRPASQLAYHVGRIGTYAALGASAGALGSLPGPGGLGTVVAAIFLVGFSASLAGFLPKPRRRIPGLAALGARLARRLDLPSRLAFGAVNGLLPCGLLYATLALAAATADPRSGALGMAVFGVGTVPALLAASSGLRHLLSRSLATRRVLAAVVLVSGLGTLGFRAGLFTPADASGSTVPPCHRSP